MREDHPRSIIRAVGQEGKMERTKRSWEGEGGEREEAEKEKRAYLDSKTLLTRSPSLSLTLTLSPPPHLEEAGKQEREKEVDMTN